MEAQLSLDSLAATHPPGQVPRASVLDMAAGPVADTPGLQELVAPTFLGVVALHLGHGLPVVASPSRAAAVEEAELRSWRSSDQTALSGCRLGVVPHPLWCRSIAIFVQKHLGPEVCVLTQALYPKCPMSPALYHSSQSFAKCAMHGFLLHLLHRQQEFRCLLNTWNWSGL